jgi:predicted aspartyl protease
MVDVLVSGSRKFRFLLDTGANASLVCDTVAKELKLERKPVTQSSGKPVMINGVPAEYVQVKELSIGDFKLADVPLIVAKFDDLNQATTEVTHGVIGTTFLSVIPVRVDFVEHELEFWYGNLPDSVVERFLASGGVQVPMKDLGGRYAIRAKLNSAVEEDMVIDSGSPNTVISNASAQALGLKSIRTDHSYKTFYGTVRAHQRLVDSISFAGQVVKNAKVWSPEIDGKQLQPILGLDILSNYEILIDAPRMRLYLKSYKTN